MKNIIILSLLAPLFLISCGKTEEVKIVVYQPVVEKQTVVTPSIVKNSIVATGSIMENSESGKVVKTSTGLTSENWIINQQIEVFSDNELKGILMKIAENEKYNKKWADDWYKFDRKLTTISDWNNKAEFLESKGRMDDKIKITIDWVEKVYIMNYNKTNKRILSKDICKKADSFDNPRCAWTYFWSFDRFKWNYLVFRTNWYEAFSTNILDIRILKTIDELHDWDILLLTTKKVFYANGRSGQLFVQDIWWDNVIQLSREYPEHYYFDKDNLYIFTKEWLEIVNLETLQKSKYAMNFDYGKNMNIVWIYNNRDQLFIKLSVNLENGLKEDFLKIYDLMNNKDIFSKKIIN